MRIAHVIDYFQPELGYQETYLAKEQLKGGHTVKVFTSDRYFPFPNFDKTYGERLGERIKDTGEYKECNIDVVRLGIKREAFTRVWLEGLKEALLLYEPDYILVHNVMTITAYKVSKIQFPKNTIVVYDDHMSGLSDEGIRHRLMRLYFNIFMKKSIEKSAAAIVSVTKAGAKFLKEKYSFPADKLKSISLGFHEDVFYKSENLREEFRNKLEVREDSLVIVYTGKINHGKGILEFVKALKKLKPQYENIKFLCIGAGDEELENVIKEELSDILIKLKFLKPEQLCGYYNASDLGIWPDGITASHIEANACGLPIIVSNWPASIERVEEGNGLALERCNSDEIYNTVSRLIENRNLLVEMQKVALDVSDGLTWGAINKKFLSIK